MRVRRFRNRRAHRSQRLSRAWTFHSQGGQRFRGVLERHIVGDDEFVQMLIQPLADLGLDVYKYPVRQNEQIRIRQYAALRI